MLPRGTRCTLLLLIALQLGAAGFGEAQRAGTDEDPRLQLFISAVMHASRTTDSGQVLLDTLSTALSGAEARAVAAVTGVRLGHRADELTCDGPICRLRSVTHMLSLGGVYLQPDGSAHVYVHSWTEEGSRRGVVQRAVRLVLVRGDTPTGWIVADTHGLFIT